VALDLKRANGQRTVHLATSLSELLEKFSDASAGVIVLDDRIVEGVRLNEFLSQLSGSAPVVLVADCSRQTEAAKFVVEGKVDFVARHGDFAAMAVSLAERHLRRAESQRGRTGTTEIDVSDELAEIFRHEINNPLTGILGNAELLLAHGAHLSPSDVQRVQTVVDLAVRLRETIRRISNSIESHGQLLKSF
jgi:nitrogen-specific signal transduction histidine kinase